MKFKLLESYGTGPGNPHRLKKISHEEAIKLMNTTFSDAQDCQPIYRGIPIEDDGNTLYLLSPNPKIHRSSANTTNYYTLIINNAPAWKQFPKREVICTTDIDTAHGYGQPFIVYPTNGAKIGVVPGADIWSQEFDSYNYYLDDIFHDMRVLNIKAAQTNYKEFLKACEHVDIYKNAGKDYMVSSSAKHYFKSYFEGNIKFIDFLQNDVYSPKGFKVLNLKTFKTDDKRHEVWTDTPCLLRPLNYEI